MVRKGYRWAFATGIDGALWPAWASVAEGPLSLPYHSTTLSRNISQFYIFIFPYPMRRNKELDAAL